MTDPSKLPRRLIPEPLRKAALAAAVLVVCEVGAQIVAPGLNGQALRDFLQAGSSTWLLRLYDWAVGGALSRGGMLAIGIMPYLSARIMVRLARVAWPRLSSWWHTDSGIARRTRMTRWLTGGLALVQSFGFAKFAQTIPGVVAHPGVGFLAKTVAVLTSGAIGVMLLSEALVKSREDDAISAHEDASADSVQEIAGRPVEPPPIEPPAATPHLLSSGQMLDSPLYAQQRERVEARPASDDDDRLHR